MWSKMLGALAVAALLALGAPLATGWLYMSVEPMRPSDKLPTFSQVQARIRGGNAETATPALDGAPWAKAERNARQVREHAREQALKTIDAVARQTCQRGDGERFAKALGYYLEQRGMQERGYAANWGKAGAHYIAQAWATPDDLRIAALTRAGYQAGRFTLDDFPKSRRDLMARLVGDAKPNKSRCG